MSFLQKSIINSKLANWRRRGGEWPFPSFGNHVFEQETFKHVSFSNSKLDRVLFRHCVLDWVSFNKAALHNCVFIGCNITNSTFKGADLSTCIFDTNVFCLDNKFDGNTEFPPQYAWVKKLRFNALTDREQAKVWQDYPGDGPEGEDYITMLSFEYCGKL